VDIAKTTPAVNWPGLAQQLLKARGALAPVPPSSYAHDILLHSMDALALV